MSLGKFNTQNSKKNVYICALETNFKDMKLTIIGGGNMGGAAAIGLSKHAQVCVTARHEETLNRFRPYGINTSTDNRKAVEDADIVAFAVKPWLMKEVVEGVADCLEGKIIVSMAPGVKYAEMKSWLKEDSRLVYVIPNTAIEFGESMSFIMGPTQEALEVKELFDKVGESVIVRDESLLIAGTSLASCGTAYALKYIEAAAEGGEGLGFSGPDALKAVRQTMKGALRLLEEKPESSPAEEIRKVTTPGGMTAKGLAAMEESGFTEAVKNGLYANR